MLGYRPVSLLGARLISLSLSLSLYISISIYIYICIHTYTYIGLFAGSCEEETLNAEANLRIPRRLSSRAKCYEALVS